MFLDTLDWFCLYFTDRLYLEDAIYAWTKNCLLLFLVSCQAWTTIKNVGLELLLVRLQRYDFTAALAITTTACADADLGA